MNITELYNDCVAVKIEKQAEKSEGGIQLMPNQRLHDYHLGVIENVGNGHLVPALGWVALPFKKGDKVIVQLGATILATIKSKVIGGEDTYITKAASILGKVSE
jgi:co-chaperonin GroES (HSP10)